MFRKMLITGLHLIGDSALDVLSDETGKDKETIIQDLDLVYKRMAEAAEPLLLEQGYLITGRTDEGLTGSLATALSATHLMAAYTIAKHVVPEDLDGDSQSD